MKYFDKFRLKNAVRTKENNRTPNKMNKFRNRNRGHNHQCHEIKGKKLVLNIRINKLIGRLTRLAFYIFRLIGITKTSNQAINTLLRNIFNNSMIRFSLSDGKSDSVKLILLFR